MTCEEWIAGIRLRGGDCHNKATDVALVGDGKAIMAQMNAPRSQAANGSIPRNRHGGR